MSRHPTTKAFDEAGVSKNFKLSRPKKSKNQPGSSVYHLLEALLEVDWKLKPSSRNHNLIDWVLILSQATGNRASFLVVSFDGCHHVKPLSNRELSTTA
jgi:hypothetical protein